MGFILHSYESCSFNIASYRHLQPAQIVSSRFDLHNVDLASEEKDCCHGTYSWVFKFEFAAMREVGNKGVNLHPNISFMLQ